MYIRGWGQESTDFGRRRPEFISLLVFFFLISIFRDVSGCSERNIAIREMYGYAPLFYFTGSFYSADVEDNIIRLW